LDSGDRFLAARRNPQSREAWTRLSDDALLKVRLCDLPLRLEDSWVAGLIEQVKRELLAKGLRVNPHFWLSEEWFSPQGVPGVAVPFYLAHPRLIRLERHQMLEAEGATRKSCLKLLRHEVGHAVEHAFRFHRRRSWQKHFGRSSQPYPEFYCPNPSSRRYVLHLDYWYAQAHPDEDFAETFAEWLTPRSNWKSRYKGWPALKKLVYLDELMSEVADKKPAFRSRARPEHLPRLRQTLGEYYAHKHERFEGMDSHVYDADLRRLFSASASQASPTAAAFLTRTRVRIRHQVARCTGRHEYAIDLVLSEMIARCRKLKLRAITPADELINDLAVLVSARSVEFVYQRREWHAM
jgi:hypothetical protein